MASTLLPSVLLVMADAGEARRVSGFLQDRHVAVQWVEDARTACERLGEQLFDGVVMDSRPLHGEGLRLLALALERYRECCCVFLAEPEDIGMATEGVCAGAYDYQTKPVNLEKLEATLQRGLANQRLSLENTQLRQRLDQRYGLSTLVGQSRSMARLYSTIREAAQGDGPLLIHGEAGTGKDFVAQAIHHSSARRDKIFAKVRCDVLEDARLEEVASGSMAKAVGDGVVYLEGVEHIPLRHQEGLATSLQQGALGDARLMVATDGPLEVVQAAGGLAPALVQVFGSGVIGVAALRDRAEDVDSLLERALAVAMERHGKPIGGISVALRQRLDGYGWPGNVRELFNLVDGLVQHAAAGAMLEVEGLPASMGLVAEGEDLVFPVGTPLAAMERAAIEAAMVACRGKKEQCAKTLGMSLRTLYRKLKEYEVEGT